MNVFRVGSARELIKDTSWFRDSGGRYVLFRGINFASRSKLPPYLPVAPLDQETINLDDLKKELNRVSPQFEYMKDLGLNIVRLVVMWKAIEPKPNPNQNQILSEGEQYLQLIKEIVDTLYVHGLFVIIDFHQDIAHGVYGGDGFPDWALAIDGTHPRPPQSDFKNKGWAAAYYVNYLVQRTLRSFWRNNLTNSEAGLENFAVRTHLEKTIGQTVSFFKNVNNGQGHPAILGVQPFNEPHPVGIDKQTFEEDYLKDFYSNVLTEINKVDSRLFILIEPRVDWNIYSAVNISEPHMDWSKHNPFQNGIESQLGFIQKKSQIHTWLPKDSNFLDQFKS